MPTENRSSNTEMVSVPRDLLARVSSAEIGMSARKDRHQAAFELRSLLASSPSHPHPEPIAWMVGTAFWWTKEEAERDAEETGLPIVGLGPMSESIKPAIPEDYCLMPKRLTAENGAKALLLGEFKLEVTQECPECRELDEPVEGCQICDGEGEYGQPHIIPWDQIKYIHSEAVRGLAIQPNTIRETA